MAKRYWLMKSEPDVFSIADLKQKKTSLWDGVRNYQARNFMMKDMKVGDEILFYHSNAKPPGVAGTAVVSAAAIPDPTALDKNSKYFDPKASKENPIWYCVEVKFRAAFAGILGLDEMKKMKPLKNMMVIKKGMRLSIQPVTPGEFKAVVDWAQSHD
ncbi:MAG: EVE domain-containing protein [Bdellovibrionaceae bacterium]|nr:EVE domain-containing protein [Bdellovibrionales bacterium]MCB9083122.1 EVE domain-containing protein [Pseudobdellovibrionaceae bacterium]